MIRMPILSVEAACLSLLAVLAPHAAIDRRAGEVDHSEEALRLQRRIGSSCEPVSTHRPDLADCMIASHTRWVWSAVLKVGSAGVPVSTPRRKSSTAWTGAEHVRLSAFSENGPERLPRSGQATTKGQAAAREREPSRPGRAATAKP
jgi:hypothetical protein